MLNTDLCIVGSGPSSLLAVLEAGLLNLRCHVISGFDHEEATTPCLADQQLSAILMEQIQTFQPVFLSGERIKNVNHIDDMYHIVTSQNNEILCRSIVVVI